MLVPFSVNGIVEVDIFVSASSHFCIFSILFLFRMHEFVENLQRTCETCETCIEEIEFRTIGEKNFAVQYNTMCSTVFKFQQFEISQI